MTCPVADLLEQYDGIDRQQLEELVNDATRQSAVTASMLRRTYDAYTISGTDVLKHRARTCACGGWID